MNIHRYIRWMKVILNRLSFTNNIQILSNMKQRSIRHFNGQMTKIKKKIFVKFVEISLLVGIVGKENNETTFILHRVNLIFSFLSRAITCEACKVRRSMRFSHFDKFCSILEILFTFSFGKK